MTEAELDDFALGPIKRLISNKAPSELLAIRDELRLGLAAALKGLEILPVGDAHRRVGEDGCIAIRNHICQRRLEVSFLNGLLG